MEQLDIADGFDVHEYRHGLKLLSEDRQTMHLENREEFTCPACDEPFERLFVTEKPTNTFGNPESPFCIARTDETVLLLTH
jgi:hypothetical protein